MVSSARNHPEKILTSTAGERFTPGPWEAVRSIPEEGFDGWHINSRPNPVLRGFTHNIGWVNGPQVNEANARLISAAPDMYEALIAALPYVECELDNAAYKRDAVAKAVAAMNAAIAKAEGKS